MPSIINNDSRQNVEMINMQSSRNIQNLILITNDRYMHYFVHCLMGFLHNFLVPRFSPS